MFRNTYILLPLLINNSNIRLFDINVFSLLVRHCHYILLLSYLFKSYIKQKNEDIYKYLQLEVVLCNSNEDWFTYIFC